MATFLEAINDYSTEILTFAGVLSALAAIATAIFAQKTLATARDENTERQQPVMMAELRPAKNSEVAVDLVVSNVGPTVARNVEVTFDPPLNPELAAEDGVSKFILSRYARPIPTVAPGQELSNVWHSGRPKDGSGRLANALNTPDVFDIKIVYSGLRGQALQVEYKLQVETIADESFSTSSKSIPGSLQSLVKYLKKIEESASHIARHLSSEGET